jgi:hypothetical protein
MAVITTSQIGNGTTNALTDIVEKDLEMVVSNRTKDKTPVLNMCMSKKRKVGSTRPLWTNDINRLPVVQANQEGAAVTSSQAENNSRANLGTYTQIFSTVIAASGTARAVVQSGGDPVAYQQVKQLIQLWTDVEAQVVRADQIGTSYAGQSGIAPGLPSGQTGRRFGSLNAFAGSHSFNTTSGTLTGFTTNTNNSDTDVAVAAPGVFQILANGTQFYTGTFTDQQFAPSIYKQLVTVAESRFNANIRTMVCPTSLRTHLSDQMPTSRAINRVNSERGDTISTYEGDFDYTYQIFDSWSMDYTGVQNQVYFFDETILEWGGLRELGPNNEIFSNADASLNQFIMEGCLIVKNPAGVGVLHNILPSGAAVAIGELRPAALVKHITEWDGQPVG